MFTYISDKLLAVMNNNTTIYMGVDCYQYKRKLYWDACRLMVLYWGELDRSGDCLAVIFS